MKDGEDMVRRLVATHVVWIAVAVITPTTDCSAVKQLLI
jgi:hypothetical protein